MESTVERKSKEVSVFLLVGDLSPAKHKGLHQGWKQTSIHLLLD